MTGTYTTKQKDTWDMIAKEVYGDEKYSGLLMENNYKYLDVFIFDSGIVLNVQELQNEIVADSTLPPWRQ